MNATRDDHSLSMSVVPNASPVVYVVDDDLPARESLELLIRSAGWQTQTFPSATEFLQCEREPVPACLVLAVALADINGLNLLQRVVAQGDQVPVVMTSGHGDVPTTVRAMKAGAFDFVTKPVNGESLLTVIAEAFELSHAALRKRAELRDLQERQASLTRREREVMEGVVAGRLNKQVAFDLGISEITVKAHRGQMVQKMQAKSVPHLVHMAARLYGSTRP